MVLDESFWPALARLASCLCREIESARLPAPCFCGVLPGQIVPLEYCTDCGDRCGMAWVRVETITPMISGGGFGQVAERTGCEPLRASVEVGIIRCAPMPGSDGEPPSMAEQLAATQLQMADMAAGLRAIKACFSERDYAVDTWNPVGPTGGCVGGTWMVTLHEDI